MTLWSQPLSLVYERHPLALITSSRIPHLLAVLLGVVVWLWVGELAPTHLRLLVLAWLGLIVVSVALKWAIIRHRSTYQITETGIILTQGQVEQDLPFGENADYTLTRGPVRRLLNLPAVLHLKGQQNVMRSWTLVWPIADTHVDDLRRALDSVLKGKSS
jgi:hypothetical protein